MLPFEIDNFTVGLAVIVIVFVIAFIETPSRRWGENPKKRWKL